MRVPKAALLMAQRIVQEIDASGLKEGDVLPSERAMLDTYQIGRGTLREALRFLEFQGVIALKPGPRGGPVLLHPSASFLASNLVLFQQLSGSPFGDVVQTRTTLEPPFSAYAAENIDEEFLSALHETVGRMREHVDSASAFMAADDDFHRLIAARSSNGVFSYLVDALVQITRDKLASVGFTQRRCESIIDEHDAVLAALSEGDPQLTETRMRAHLDNCASDLARNFPQILDDVVPWTPVSL